MVTASPSGAHSEPAAAAAKQDGSRLAFIEQAVRTRWAPALSRSRLFGKRAR